MWSSEDEMTCDSAHPENADNALDEYQRKAHKTSLYPQNVGIVCAVLGLSSESGELAGKLKKMFRGDPGVTYADLAQEAGDCLWYVAETCTFLGLNLSEVADLNLQKLLDREARGTIKGSGDDR